MNILKIGLKGDTCLCPLRPLNPSLWIVSEWIIGKLNEWWLLVILHFHMNVSLPLPLIVNARLQRLQFPSLTVSSVTSPLFLHSSTLPMKNLTVSLLDSSISHLPALPPLIHPPHEEPYRFPPWRLHQSPPRSSSTRPPSPWRTWRASGWSTWSVHRWCTSPGTLSIHTCEYHRRKKRRWIHLYSGFLEPAIEFEIFGRD